jgi:all-trans-retinol 13,14-reductase
MSSYIQSSWRLKGGGNMIIDSLVNDIKSFGGEVVCRAEVEELVEQDGRIVAAKCSNGQTYEAKAFISDVHPQLTFGWLKDSRIMKGIFRRRINALENTFGMFTASLVLKPNVLPYFNHNKYVYRKANVWTFHEDIDDVGGVMVSCRVPESRDYARQIDLLTPMPWTLCKDWEDTHVGRRGEIYEQQKQRMTDECIRLAERVIPGLRDMVENATPHSDYRSEKCYTSTPLTWRDYTLSPCGSAFGIRKDCRQSLITMLSPKTPIPNLFLTGQSLVLHGLEGVTMTAFKTLETIKNEKF